MNPNCQPSRENTAVDPLTVGQLRAILETIDQRLNNCVVGDYKGTALIKHISGDVGVTTGGVVRLPIE
jgi:hypothetical protein